MVRTRRRWTEEQKEKLLAECDLPGSSLTAVAKAYGIAPRLLFQWRQDAKESATVWVAPKLVAASRLKEAEEKIERLEKLLKERDAGCIKANDTKLSATGRVRAEGRIITLLNRGPATRAKLLANIGFEVLPTEIDELLQSMVSRGLVERFASVPSEHGTCIYRLAIGMRVQA